MRKPAAATYPESTHQVPAHSLFGQVTEQLSLISSDSNVGPYRYLRRGRGRRRAWQVMAIPDSVQVEVETETTEAVQGRPRWHTLAAAAHHWTILCSPFSTAYSEQGRDGENRSRPWRSNLTSHVGLYLD